MNRENKEAFRNILDTFTGADGGVKFIKFRAHLEDIEKRNDVDSKKVLKIMTDFSKLINVLQGG